MVLDKLVGFLINLFETEERLVILFGEICLVYHQSFDNIGLDGFSSLKIKQLVDFLSAW